MINTNLRINILMSTYNGAEFVGAQIESIQNQTVQNWQLLIRDDGSSDDTMAIIRSYARDDSRIIILSNPESKQLGVHRSFYELTKAAKADFYLYSDQDDIWLPNKIKIFILNAESHDPDIPTMWYSDVTVVDENLKETKPRLLNANQQYHAMTWSESFLTNTVAGMASMINDKLASLWQFTNIGLHDSYLSSLALATGELVYIDIPLVLYRQHHSNAIGIKEKHAFEAIDSFWAMLNTSQLRVSDIITKYQAFLDPEVLNSGKSFVRLKYSCMGERINIVVHNRYKRSTAFETIVARVLLITQWRNKARHREIHTSATSLRPN